MKEIYFDASASYLKPKSVIETEFNFLNNHYANAGRGICKRSVLVDEMIKKNRDKVASFIGAKFEQIVFTGGATDSLNRIVRILEINKMINKKSIIFGSVLEHNSASLPFVYLGYKVVNLELNKNLDVDIRKITKSDVIIITAMSNVLGQKQDVEKIIKKAKQLNKNVISIVDVSQYVVHLPIDVKKWNCDFLCFSGHKIGTDTGVGILYIKEPYKYKTDKIGGGTIVDVNNNKIELLEPPFCYEAGTLPLTQIIGFIPAINELLKPNNTRKVFEFLYDELLKIQNIKLLTKKDAYIINFYPLNISCFDLGMFLANNNICVRVGKMCANSIYNFLNINSSIRISVGYYNTLTEAKYFIKTLKEVLKKC